MARPPPPNPLPQGEGRTVRINRDYSPSPCGRGLGGGGLAMTRNHLTLLGLVAARRRAGRRPGQQVVDSRRRPSPGGRPDRPAPGPEPHDGLEQRRHLRPADRLRPVELPPARGHRARRGRRPRRLAPPRRIAAWWRRRSAPSWAARSATSSTGCASAPWSISSTPMSAPGPGTSSTSPTPPSSAAWRRWSSTACCRARDGPAPPDEVLATRRDLRLENRAMPPSIRRCTTVLALAACAAAMSGCSGGDQISRSLGLVRDAPDEFTVTTRAPLAMPPSFALPPPTPGCGAAAGAIRTHPGGTRAGATDGPRRRRPKAAAPASRRWSRRPARRPPAVIRTEVDQAARE